jgi:hypothetical protein
MATYLAHGIMGMSPKNFSVPVAAEYGSFYVQSNPTELHYCLEIFSNTLPAVVSDFDPLTINADKYYEILKCLEENSGGIDDCVDLCEQWPYFGREESSSSDEPSQMPTGTSIASTNTQAYTHVMAMVLATFFIVMHDGS